MRIKRLSGLVGKARLRSNQMRQYFNAIVIDRAAGTECIEIGKLPPHQGCSRRSWLPNAMCAFVIASTTDL